MASLKPLLITIRRPRVVTSELAPTNHCDDAGPEQIAPPAQLPARLCHTTGVTPFAETTTTSLAIGKRRALNGIVLVLAAWSR